MGAEWGRWCDWLESLLVAQRVHLGEADLGAFLSAGSLIELDEDVAGEWAEARGTPRLPVTRGCTTAFIEVCHR